MIYLICFAISIFLLCIPIKNKTGKLIMVFFSILITCCLAGFRALSVGTDTSDYPLSMYKLAQHSSYGIYMKSRFMHMWKEEYVYDMGIGYSTLIYAITKVFNSFTAILFFTAAIIEICVYKAIFILFKPKYRPISVALFYLLFYNASLNNMRQSLAMAILLLGFAFLIVHDKKWFLFALIGVTFHKTAICGLIVYVIFAILEYIKYNKIRIGNGYGKKIIMVIFLVMLTAYFIFNIDVTRNILSKIGLARFLNYFSGAINISIGRIVLELPMLLVIIANWKYMEKKSLKYFILAYSCINLIMSQINTMNVLAWRISAYISIYVIVLFPLAIAECKKTKRVRLEKMFLYGYGIVYWFYYYYINNLHETLPYLLS